MSERHRTASLHGGHDQWIFRIWSLAATITFLGTVALAATDRLHPAVAVAIGTLFAVVSVLARRRDDVPNVLLALATALVCFGLPEIGLRLTDFRHASHIVAEGDRGHRVYPLAQSAELFWTLVPDSPGVGPDGFPRRATDPAGVLPPEEAVDLLFLGDSVTFQGYPERLERKLESRDTHRSFAVRSYALAGYSTHQGLVLTRNLVGRVPADLVVVAFGWNDHWLAQGAPDHLQRVVSSDSRLAGWSLRILHSVRLLQGLHALRSAASSEPLSSGALRVSPERFRENLVAIGSTWEDQAQVVLLTLPDDHGVGRVPDELVRLGRARSAESVIRLHDAYADLVREVARERRWALLDLALAVDRLPAVERASLFLDDGIHLSDEGLLYVAEWIAPRIRALTASTPADPFSEKSSADPER